MVVAFYFIFSNVKVEVCDHSCIIHLMWFLKVCDGVDHVVLNILYIIFRAHDCEIFHLAGNIVREIFI